MVGEVDKTRKAEKTWPIFLHHENFPLQKFSSLRNIFVWIFHVVCHLLFKVRDSLKTEKDMQSRSCQISLHTYIYVPYIIYIINYLNICLRVTACSPFLILTTPALNTLKIANKNTPLGGEL
jgi:hypothetical protein